MRKLLVLFIAQMVLLSACASQPQTPDSTITIGVTTNLTHYRNEIYACGQSAKQSIRVDAYPIGILMEGDYDSILQVGMPDGNASLDIESGNVRMIFITNPQNPVSQLSPSQLANILLGMTTDWRAIAPTDFPISAEIRVWSYPSGDDVRQLVERMLLDGRMITPRSSVAPDAQAMVEAISKESSSIGYLLDINPRETVKSLNILPESPLTQPQPIIARFPENPEGDLKDIFVCLSGQEK